MSSVQKILDRKGHTVHTVTQGTTVLDAARQMNEHRVGALVVTSEGKMTGIFTERDILCRVVAAQRDPAGTEVREVMTSPVACCAPETTRDECRAVMRERRLRHLPVIKDDKLLGMISIGDLNEAVQADQEQTIQYLTEYVLGSWE